MSCSTWPGILESCATRQPERVRHLKHQNSSHRFIRCATSLGLSVPRRGSDWAAKTLGWEFAGPGPMSSLLGTCIQQDLFLCH
jgi:hypothetical protein